MMNKYKLIILFTTFHPKKFCLPFGTFQFTRLIPNIKKCLVRNEIIKTSKIFCWKINCDQIFVDHFRTAIWPFWNYLNCFCHLGLFGPFLDVNKNRNILGAILVFFVFWKLEFVLFETAYDQNFRDLATLDHLNEIWTFSYDNIFYCWLMMLEGSVKGYRNGTISCCCCCCRCCCCCCCCVLYVFYIKIAICLFLFFSIVFRNFIGRS